MLTPRAVTRTVPPLRLLGLAGRFQDSSAAAELRPQSTPRSALLAPRLSSSEAMHSMVATREISTSRVFSALGRVQDALFPPQTSFKDAVVVPLPGVMVNNKLFSRVGCLATAVGARAVDFELGEEACLNANNVSGVAEHLARRLAERYGPDAKAILLGHSFGGYAALEFAKRTPDNVAGLVLISTQCRGDSKSAQARRHQQIAMMHKKGFSAIVESVVTSLLGISDPGVMKVVRGMAKDVGPEAFERQVWACAFRSDQRKTLEQLPKTIPVLCMGGAEDKITPPRCLKEMRQLLTARDTADASAMKSFGIPSWLHPYACPTTKTAPWQCVTRKGAGHMMPLEQPQAFRAALTAWAAEVRNANPDAEANPASQGHDSWVPSGVRPLEMPLFV